MTNNSVKMPTWLVAFVVFTLLLCLSFVIWDEWGGRPSCWVDPEPVTWPLAGEIWIELDELGDIRGDVCVWVYNAQLRDWEALGGPLCPKDVPVGESSIWSGETFYNNLIFIKPELKEVTR